VLDTADAHAEVVANAAPGVPSPNTTNAAAPNPERYTHRLFTRLDIAPKRIRASMTQPTAEPYVIEYNNGAIGKGSLSLETAHTTPTA
jgi:hypothetical protein